MNPLPCCLDGNPALQAGLAARMRRQSAAGRALLGRYDRSGWCPRPAGVKPDQLVAQEPVRAPYRLVQAQEKAS